VSIHGGYVEPYPAFCLLVLAIARLSGRSSSGTARPSRSAKPLIRPWFRARSGPKPGQALEETASVPSRAMHLQNQETVNARAHAATYTGRSRFVVLVSLTLTVLVFLTLVGCRRSMPVDTAPQAAAPADGMLRGTIRGSAGSIPVDGRTVEVVNVTTGQRQHVTTGDTGGFSMRLTPGKYRVDLVLRGGESVVQRPGIIELDSSDPDARADFVVGTVPVSRPHGPAYRLDDGLGSPIA
jgi:carboxypeptidase family protein